MACFGLVNGGYASLVAWLPAFYQSRGWSGTHSGGLLALMALAQAGAALLLPALTARWRDRRPWLWLTLALRAAGFAAFAAWPDTSAACLGRHLRWGLGGCFALCLIVALDHLPDAEQAGELSALMGRRLPDRRHGALGAPPCVTQAAALPQAGSPTSAVSPWCPCWSHGWRRAAMARCHSRGVPGIPGEPGRAGNGPAWQTSLGASPLRRRKRTRAAGPFE